MNPTLEQLISANLEKRLTTLLLHRRPRAGRCSFTIALTALLFSSAQVFGQAAGAPGPGVSDPRNANAQRNGGVSTTIVPQTQPLSPYIIRPEQAIEHPPPVQPPQPQWSPSIRPQPMRDTTAPRKNSGAVLFDFTPNTPSLSQNFQGLTATGWIPPDPIIAAGPNHVIVATNSSFAIYTKSGLRQYSTTFWSWFAALNPPSAIFDPKVVYDANAGRWILFLLAKDQNASRSYYLISVSQNSDPNGQWWNWSLDAGLNGTTASGLWADFPGIGYDSAEAVYLTSNQYTFAGLSHYAKVRILYKSQLYWVGSGGSLFPTSASFVYNSPFALTSSTTVNAIAIKSGLTDSAVATARFTKCRR